MPSDTKARRSAHDIKADHPQSPKRKVKLGNFELVDQDTSRYLLKGDREAFEDLVVGMGGKWSLQFDGWLIDKSVLRRRTNYAMIRDAKLPERPKTEQPDTSGDFVNPMDEKDTSQFILPKDSRSEKRRDDSRRSTKSTPPVVDEHESEESEHESDNESDSNSDSGSDDDSYYSSDLDGDDVNFNLDHINQISDLEQRVTVLEEYSRRMVRKINAILRILQEHNEFIKTGSSDVKKTKK